MHILNANLMLGYTAFVIGVASPGPSVLAVMGTAMAQGRTRALALAAGIVSGSLCWGLSAAFGLAALMQRWSAALMVVKAIGEPEFQSWLIESQGITPPSQTENTPAHFRAVHQRDIERWREVVRRSGASVD